jgi:YggT family protein
MIAQAIRYIVETVFELFVLAALLRFYAQAFRAPFRNPITDFVVALTDWVIKPMRKLVPGMMGLDMASLLAAWIALMAMYLLILGLADSLPFTHVLFWPSLALIALVRLLRLSIYLLIGIVIIQAILSWTGPYHPIRPFFDALSRPFLRPLQRLIPLVGGVDLSPLVLLVVLQIMLMLPVAFLEFETKKMMNRLASS